MVPLPEPAFVLFPLPLATLVWELGMGAEYIIGIFLGVREWVGYNALPIAQMDAHHGIGF